eukprot:GHVT01082618.1.p1 GENE.GHVT01082618.1~~GHVT01082618.1.p1  ORF type:complete len:469 (-),score=31.93 GHVT01082618.1:713-2119(-)
MSDCAALPQAVTKGLLLAAGVALGAVGAFWSASYFFNFEAIRDSESNKLQRDEKQGRPDNRDPVKLISLLQALENVELAAGNTETEPQRKITDRQPSLECTKVAEEALLKKEQFSRNRQFFGDEGQRIIEQRFVVVVGLGGVGSHCAVSLARSGVGYIRLIDFDRVTLSSLNRHATATREEVGLSKVDSVVKLIRSVCPDADVDGRVCLYEASRSEELLYRSESGDGNYLARKPDFVVDCIDNVPTKVDLIAFCKERDISLISACGAGAKADPSRVCITDISTTEEDELARACRTRLRARGISSGVPMCLSTERTKRGLLPLNVIQEDDPDEYRPLDNFRVRIMPVIAPLPAMFGHAMASYVLCHLAKQPFDCSNAAATSAASHRITISNFRKLFGVLKSWYTENGTLKISAAGVEVPFSDARLLFSDIYHGASIISGRTASPGTLQIVPWWVIVKFCNLSKRIGTIR